MIKIIQSVEIFIMARYTKRSDFYVKKQRVNKQAYGVRD